MPTPRSGLYAGVIDGKLYTVAGNNSSGVSGILEIYDPVSNSWTTDPSEPTARYGVTGGVINSKLYVTGGFAASGSTGALDIFTPAMTPMSTPTSTPTPTPPVPSVTSVVNTGSFNINEMSLDPTNGDIYLNGYDSGSSELSIVKITSGSLTMLYSPLPGTTGGNLTYTNGFAVHAANLWWNNANAGPGFATELSSAAKVGGGPITRRSPTDDLDSLSSDGTTLFTAYYAGSLYTVTSSGGLNYIGFHRGTVHLAIAADSGVLYVVDDGGAYRRD